MTATAAAVGSTGGAPVVAAAVQHAVASHRHEDTPELREGIRSVLEPESAYVPGERVPEPFPG